MYILYHEIKILRKSNILGQGSLSGDIAVALNVNSNFSASTAHRSLSKSNAGMSLALAKLAAGRPVLSAKDDAAALAIGSRLGAEVSGLMQAQSNARQGASMLQVADGGMTQVNDMLSRMKSLAVQAGSGHLTSSDREALNTEYQALASEIDRVAADTDFAGTKLLDGSGGEISIQVGTGTNPADDSISFTLNDTSTAALAIGGHDISSQSGADAAGAAISNALDSVQTLRAGIGASQNRLDYAAQNIGTAIENTEAARSSLIDLDVASAISDLVATKTQSQAGIAMLAQANLQPKSLLKLFA
jgi:flagellin